MSETLPVANSSPESRMSSGENLTVTHTPTDPTKPAKDPKTGKFLKGNISKQHKENPWIKAYNNYRNAFIKSVKKEDMADVCAKVLEQAKRGNYMQQRLLFEYLIPKPKAEIDVNINNISNEEVANRINIIFGIIPPENPVDGLKEE